ncbi:MAG: toxin-antitoxin system YwqK family antitoxin [Crocinitomicaceae bacterium]|nr:toxin-antitoxin system YwqK family antitoxin [Crocinitomicaceae bacterium]
MKYIIGLIILIGFSSQVNAQFGSQEEVDSCYFRWITVQYKDTIRNIDTVRRVRMTQKQIRYAEWECGNTPGLIDCNSDLSYDEASNTVFKKQTDISIVAGANKPFTGDCESCHMNGRLQRKVTFINGKENGKDTTYYNTGCPQVIRSLVNGVEHGQWLFMYDSTQFLAWEMNYYMGEKEGVQKFFAKPENISKTEFDIKYRSDTTKIEHYKAGILHGVKKTYYRRGKDGMGGSCKREVNYKNGVFHGAFLIYNLERVIIEELNYKEGKKDQLCKYYYDDGVLLKTESWKEGVKNGEFKTFYYQGHIQVSENYKKGEKEGWFEVRYPDKTIKSRALYKKGERIEEHRYDQHGRETYSFGTPTGNEQEDDDAPTTDKKKKKKKSKKEKKKD